MKKIEMLGKQYGRLTVQSEVGRIGGHLSYLCVCDCGKQTTISGPNLRNGTTKSCGCLRSEKSSERVLKHGMSLSKEYKTWMGMHRRCYDSTARGYSRYGGRGISVCERWHSFENFYADMGNKPSDMSIERIDNDKSYSPENCRWATNVEQSKNRRLTINLTYNGVTMCLKDWSRKIGKPYTTMQLHYRNGYSTEQILGVTA